MLAEGSQLQLPGNLWFAVLEMVTSLEKIEKQEIRCASSHPRAHALAHAHFRYCCRCCPHLDIAFASVKKPP